VTAEGVVASALAFVVYSRALRELDASLVGAYLNLDPIAGVLPMRDCKFL
jgi:drug/metabolite transporter (DMT)-like permease